MTRSSRYAYVLEHTDIYNEGCPTPWAIFPTVSSAMGYLKARIGHELEWTRENEINSHYLWASDDEDTFVIRRLPNKPTWVAE